MAKKNNEPELQEKQLQEELSQLQAVLKQRDICPDSQENKKVVALLRLCLQLDEQVWERLTRQIDLSSWITIPLDGATYPMLVSLQNKLNKLEFEKDHDALTNLPNRRFFNRRLEMEIERSIRFKSPVSLSIMDIDDFKLVNDNYGHDCGDKVLQSLSHLLKEEIRGIDLAARIGGEEFAIIFPGTGLIKAKSVLTRLRKDILKTKVACPEVEKMLNFSCSIGVACFKGQEELNSEALIKAADQAMYVAKKNGKNRIEHAPLLGASKKIDSTLVKLEEKKFLFSVSNGQE